jgi:hypothetical protein
MYLPFLPSLSDYDLTTLPSSQYSLMDCILNSSTTTSPSSSSLFSCFGPMRRTQALGQKSFHTLFTCPITGFHTSCELEAIENNSPDDLGCYCHMMEAGTSCAILHLTAHIERYHEDPLIDYEKQIMKEMYHQQQSIAPLSINNSSSFSHSFDEKGQRIVSEMVHLMGSIVITPG